MKTDPIQIVGFAGPAGCGKDTAAQVMRLINGSRRLAFGDLVRKELWDIVFDGALPDGMPDWVVPKWVVESLFHSDLEGTDLYRKPTPETARRLLQWWGTDFRRATDRDYWVAKMDKEVAMSMACGCNAFAVSDVRFPNEANWIKALGGTVWQLARPGDSPLSDKTRAHITEHALTGYHFHGLINNSGTLSQLESILKDLLCPTSSKR